MILTILMMTAIMYFLPTMYQAVYRHGASQDSPEHISNAQNEHENSAAIKIQAEDDWSVFETC